MPEVINTFTSVEKVSKENEYGPYTIWKFQDVDGKKNWVTFKDDIGAKLESLMKQAVLVEFTVKSRQWQGKTLVDNQIDAVKDTNEMTSSVGENGAAPAATSPVANRIFAFKAAVDLLGTAPEMFDGKDDAEATPVGIVDLMMVADSIFEWATRSQEKASEPDPDPEPEPEPAVTN